ncbi:uncharacterized protein LOC129287987 [Prosopis cineraria]|uniref:uncharacterized protein LOC129287987 n=1 Tax=Prosopis cineraria TaxID=364024 RepID=UPI00240F7CA5|nr:uncharacterized protein LOC129287987 [Prosopis cineraria]
MANLLEELVVTAAMMSELLKSVGKKTEEMQKKLEKCTKILDRMEMRAEMEKKSEVNMENEDAVSEKEEKKPVEQETEGVIKKIPEVEEGREKEPFEQQLKVSPFLREGKFEADSGINPKEMKPKPSQSLQAVKLAPSSPKIKVQQINVNGAEATKEKKQNYNVEKTAKRWREYEQRRDRLKAEEADGKKKGKWRLDRVRLITYCRSPILNDGNSFGPKSFLIYERRMNQPHTTFNSSFKKQLMDLGLKGEKRNLILREARVATLRSASEKGFSLYIIFLRQTLAVAHILNAQQAKEEQKFSHKHTKTVGSDTIPDALCVGWHQRLLFLAPTITEVNILYVAASQIHITIKKNEYVARLTQKAGAKLGIRDDTNVRYDYSIQFEAVILLQFSSGFQATPFFIIFLSAIIARIFVTYYWDGLKTTFGILVTLTFFSIKRFMCCNSESIAIGSLSISFEKSVEFLLASLLLKQKSSHPLDDDVCGVVLLSPQYHLRASVIIPELITCDIKMFGDVTLLFGKFCLSSLDAVFKFFRSTVNTHRYISAHSNNSVEIQSKMQLQTSTEKNVKLELKILGMLINVQVQAAGVEDGFGEAKQTKLKIKGELLISNFLVYNIKPTRDGAEFPSNTSSFSMRGDENSQETTVLDFTEIGEKSFGFCSAKKIRTAYTKHDKKLRLFSGAREVNEENRGEMSTNPSILSPGSVVAGKQFKSIFSSNMRYDARFSGMKVEDYYKGLKKDVKIIEAVQLEDFLVWANLFSYQQMFIPTAVYASHLEDKVKLQGEGNDRAHDFTKTYKRKSRKARG